MKNQNQIFSLLLLATPAVLTSCGAGSTDSEKPNIIFIMSDDHTTQGIGAYGSRLASLNPTPTIDRIGNEGMIMDRAFCTNGISTPSRANIMSGQYSQTNGVIRLDQPLAVEKQNLPREMKKLGYQTAIIGKWHLVTQPEEFDYYNVYYGQGQYFNPVLCEKGTTDSVMVNYYGKKGMYPGKQHKGHESDVVMDLTLNWLQNIRKKDQPFFLCTHFKAPHDYFEYNPKYEDYLEDAFIPEPASMWNNGNNGSVATKGLNGELTDTIGSSVGRRNTIRNMGTDLKVIGDKSTTLADTYDENISDKDYKSKTYQEFLKRYLRCVKGVDDNVKRLFDYLEAEKMMDNTVIMYTGDQGFFLGEHDYIDKRWMYDECQQMPFMVRYPKKIKAGSHSGAIVNNVDFAETIIDIAGGEVPEYMQGDSFKDILYTGNEPEGWKQATYYRYWMHMAHQHSNPAHFGIRTKDYKLIFFYGVNYDDVVQPRSLTLYQTPAAWELYDMRKDPDEMNNVYGRPEYAEVVKDLKAQLKQMREDFNEGDENYPHIQKIIDENWDK